MTDINGSRYKIDTKNEFFIEYETEVKLADVKNEYINKASLGDNEDSAEVPIENPPRIEKNFVDSTPSGNGFALNWKTVIDLPSNGIKAGCYYEDTISDASNHPVNSNNWFTKSLLSNMGVWYGDNLLKANAEAGNIPDYSVTISGWKDRQYGTSFKDIPLSAAEEQYIITSFKITFNKNIKDSEKKEQQLKIVYSSYTNSIEGGYNTGKYTQEGVTKEDKKYGSGKGENLLEKTSIDGTENSVRPISTIYNPDTGKYVLGYKLVVNKSNTAKGNITIEDQLPAGTTLVTGPWSSGNKTFTGDGVDYINGVYVRYYLYNNHVEPPYTENEVQQATYYVKGPNFDMWDTNNNKFSAASKGTKVSVDSITNKLTIKIPKEAYSGDFEVRGYNNEPLGELKDVSFSMVIYYAVEITPENWGSYEKSFTNSCTLTVNEGKPVTKTVTDTVESEKIVKKGAYNSDDSTLSYALDINPEAKTLIEGQENKLSIEDTLIYEKKKWCNNITNHPSQMWHDAITQIALKPGSLLLYEVVKDSEGNESEKPVDSSLITDVKVEASGYSETEGKMTMTLKVPDGVHYRLRYSYMITIGKESQACNLELKVTNTASIKGIASSGTSSKDDVKIDSQGSLATSSKSYTTVILYKRDKNNQARELPNAVFQLDKYNGTDWVTIGTFTTDEHGSVQLGEQVGDEIRIGYNCAYRIREIKAPDGYKLLETDKYFWVYSSKIKIEIVPSDWKSNSLYTANRLDVMNGYLFVYDEEQESEKTDFEVSKQWKSPDGEIIKGENEIKVTLYQSTSKDDQENGKRIDEITLNDQNSWHYVWSKLEKYQTDGKTPYYYYVKETLSDDKWNVSYSNDEALAADGTNHSFVITNTSKEDTTSVKVNKVWKDSNGSELASPPQNYVTVKLKRKYPVSTDRETSNNVAVTVNLTGKSYTDTNADATKSDKITVPVGSKVTISVKSPYSNSFKGVTSFSPAVAEVGYSNSPYTYGTNGQDSGTIETVSFRVYRNTTVNIGNAACVYDFTSFEVERDENAGIAGVDGWVEDSSFEDVRNLTSANGWQYSWDTLAKTSPAGTPYYYYVIEEPAVEGFKTEYCYKASGEGEKVNAQGVTGGSVTVTNTKKQSINVTVVKAWEGYEATEYNTYKVTMRLRKNDQPYGDAITLSSENSWTYTWSGLDDGFEYSVREESVTDSKNEPVNNFDTKYTVTVGSPTQGNGLNATGTITITNTKKTQEITLPGTGGKDGWIFYGLGISFWAISLIWLSLTFKKRNKLIKAAKEGQKGIP